jgi:hypothetical protein
VIICGKLQNFILFFKTPVVLRKDFFEIYAQFGSRAQKVSPSPLLDSKGFAAVVNEN